MLIVCVCGFFFGRNARWEAFGQQDGAKVRVQDGYQGWQGWVSGGSSPKDLGESRTARLMFRPATPALSLMLVGIGGNNGTTVAATILANKHNISWSTKLGPIQPNYIGSLVRASTVRIGADAETGKDVNVPIYDMLPMVHPNDLVLGGWDISGLPMDQAMARAQVLDYDLQRQVAPLMKEMGAPLPSIYYPDFIAANQEDRADNVIQGENKWEHVQRIRKDIAEFKEKHGLDKVVVLWTANTERYSELIDGVNDTADNLLSELREEGSWKVLV